MKDVYGDQRGKCNSCSCREYLAPSESDHHRCEYCNHTPNEHVRIIELGPCKKCKQGECDAYESEDPNSYTECQYCGCPAQHHEGAEALRQPQSASGGIPSGLGMPFGPGIPSMSRGTCDFPGCDRPKYVENDGRVHDFCGRTCARKFAELQKKHSQKQKPATAAAHKGKGYPHKVPQQPGYLPLCTKCMANPAAPGNTSCQQCMHV